MGGGGQPAVVSAGGNTEPPTYGQPNTKRRKVERDEYDDMYDGIQSLYAEDDAAPVIILATCGSEVMRQSAVSRSGSSAIAN